jgi:hypothetical protein
MNPERETLFHTRCASTSAMEGAQRRRQLTHQRQSLARIVRRGEALGDRERLSGAGLS